MVSFKLDKEIQKDAFHLVMFLYRAYNLITTFLILFTKHDAINITDPSSKQDVYHI